MDLHIIKLLVWNLESWKFVGINYSYSRYILNSLNQRNHWLILFSLLGLESNHHFSSSSTKQFYVNLIEFLSLSKNFYSIWAVMQADQTQLFCFTYICIKPQHFDYPSEGKSIYKLRIKSFLFFLQWSNKLLVFSSVKDTQRADSCMFPRFAHIFEGIGLSKQA